MREAKGKKTNKTEVETEKEVAPALVDNYLKLPMKKGGFFQAVIEVEKGSKERWEVKTSTPDEFTYKKDFKKKFLAAYGFIPGTLAGDGDCVDCYVIGDDLKRGDIVSVSILGMMPYEHDGKEDNKVFAIAHEISTGKNFLRRFIKFLKKLRKIVAVKRIATVDKEKTIEFINSKKLNEAEKKQNQHRDGWGINH